MPGPFGLVMIEAMVCRTSVIVYNYGAVSEVIEIIDDGTTGFILSRLEEADKAVEMVPNLSS